MNIKSLDDNTRIQIEELSEVSGIAPALLEKDWMINEVIQAVSKIRVEDVVPVFCGGTCLSQAYRILDRMSEDIDFKLVSFETQEVSAPSSKNARRKQLHQICNQIVLVLKKSGFDVVGREDARLAEEVARKNGKISNVTCDVTARDDNQYQSIEIRYLSVFDTIDNIRPGIKLELNFTSLVLNPSKKSSSSILEISRRGAQNSGSSIGIECVDLVEATAEKLVSFPRRLAQILRKSENKNPLNDPRWDKALVRHIYDVFVITKKHPEILNGSLLSEAVEKVIKKDQMDFKNQHPDFFTHPLKEIAQALELASKHPLIAKQYDDFLLNMLFDHSNAPDFKNALNSFTKAWSSALKSDITKEYSGGFLGYLQEQEIPSRQISPRV